MGVLSNSALSLIFKVNHTFLANDIFANGSSLTFNDNILLYFGSGKEYNINSDGTTFFINQGATHLIKFGGSSFFTYQPFLPTTANNLSLGGSANEFLSLYLGDGAN